MYSFIDDKAGRVKYKYKYESQCTYMIIGYIKWYVSKNRYIDMEANKERREQQQQQQIILEKKKKKEEEVVEKKDDPMEKGREVIRESMMSTCDASNPDDILAYSRSVQKHDSSLE
ncbi:uncharacterized protein LOC110910968 [Helianthus annuus]|uniref:uncharacterized protein LOC110910968 n=1 Tax=Helianthus annuus TaxID=4232 RepID=UPI000B8FFBE4|nr:uncharacterized protein LOC110910968 [Helianthus annuus]